MNQLNRPFNRTTPFADLTIPPDPDGCNAVQAKQARDLMEHYRKVNNDFCDFEDSICSLLTGLMHMADREVLDDGETAMNFFVQLERARGYYALQTRPRAVPCDADAT